MCNNPNELSELVREYREYKAMQEQIKTRQEEIKDQIVEFLLETEGCETINKDGRKVYKYVGNDFKLNYSGQIRENIDKKAVKELLGEEAYMSVINISTYPVLRVS